MLNQNVSYQITDAVTQTNVQVMAAGPAMAMGSVYQAAAHSTGLMFQNAVHAQAQQNILSQAATIQGITKMYSIDTVANAISIARMLRASSKI